MKAQQRGCPERKRHFAESVRFDPEGNKIRRLAGPGCADWVHADANGSGSTFDVWSERILRQLRVALRAAQVEKLS
jgi:hypothetical protein